MTSTAGSRVATPPAESRLELLYALGVDTDASA
jgi:hypothetical protein